MGDRFSLSRLFHQPPRGYDRRVVEVAPGGALAYDPEWWRGRIVLVQRGVIEVQLADDPAGSRREPPVGAVGQTLGGSRVAGGYRLGQGEVFWLDGLPVRALRNAGPESVTLIAVSRGRAGDSFSGEAPSQ